MRWESAESGQATVEWVGLVLAAALALGALAGGVRGAARGESAAGLGEGLAQRITCAAGEVCAAGRGALGGRPGGALGGSQGVALGGSQGVALGGPPGGALGSPAWRPPAPPHDSPPGGRGAPTTGLSGGVPPSAPWQRPPSGAPGLGALPRAGRAAAAVAKRAWILCFGYRRWRYEVEHPRSPREAVPVDETFGILNSCLNPWAFFFG